MKHVIMDCDPGTDDAFALLFALAHPEKINVLGITTVGGNVSLERVTENALKICELVHKEIPVAAGCGRPLIRHRIDTAEYIHGISGMGGAQLPRPKRAPLKTHGVDFIIETILSSPEKVTLLPTGPLTNIAMALVKEPKIIEGIDEIIFMGGSMGAGNVPGGASEFNIFNDPHGAHVVFESPVKKTMIGLDVTEKLPLKPHDLERIKAFNTPVSKFLNDMLTGSGLYEEALQLGFDGPLIHDAAVVGFLLKPELFSGKHCPAFVEINSHRTLGQTVINWRNLEDQPTSLFVLNDVNDEGFFDLMIESLGQH